MACRRPGTLASAPADKAIQVEVRMSGVVQVGETGFEPCQGRRMWAWTASAPGAAVVLVMAGRGHAQAEELLGADDQGVLERDRGRTCERFQKAGHQLGARLRRNLEGRLPFGGEAAVLLSRIKLASGRAMEAWSPFRDGKIGRDRRTRGAKPIRRGIHKRPERIKADPKAHRKIRAFGEDLLRQEASLWTYLDHPEAEVTNDPGAPPKPSWKGAILPSSGPRAAWRSWGPGIPRWPANNNL